MRLPGTAFMPSLQHMVLTKIGVALWNQQHVKDLLAKHIALPNLSEHEPLASEWEVLETEVVENVQKLSLPNSLKQELSRFARAVGWRILMWFTYHQNFYLNDLALTDMFHWTPQGTINYKETAREILVRDQNLSISRRYELACLYCLEESIYAAWNSCFGNVEGYTFADERALQVALRDKREPAVLWSDHLGKKFVFPRLPSDFRDNVTFVTDGFHLALELNNVDAMKFFFDKLPAEKKGSHLVKTARHLVTESFMRGTQVYYTDGLCFLLSAMNEDEQMQLLQWGLLKTLAALLVWPWQEYFIEIVEHLSSSFSAKNYYELLNLIIHRATVGCQDYDYLKLFTNYWHKISVDYRKYYISQVIVSKHIINLLDIGDQQLITLVLGDASISQKEEMIFGCESKNICLALIILNNPNMLEFFFVECLRGMNDVTSKLVQLKQDFEGYKNRLSNKYTPSDCQLIWHKFFTLIDGLIDSNNKRMHEESAASVKKSRQT